MENLQPTIGDRVRVRQRAWIVRDVDSYPHCLVLTLGAVTDTAPVQTHVIVPFDDVERDGRPKRLHRVGIRAWRHACRALLAEHADVPSVRSAAAADLDLLPYQFEPALALLRGDGSRLLLADEVGLGKTVQAMLAVAELLARGAARRVLVVCPAGLREQWVQEWRSRFTLAFVVCDQQGVRRGRLALPAHVSPWRAEPLVVASVDYVKRPEVLPSVLAAGWDVVVIDEAHGSCGASERHDAVAALCRRAPYVLLLSATPHNGDEDAFASLCALGRHHDPLIVFRRTRLEAGRDAGRRAHAVHLAPTPAERRMHAALAALTRAVLRESTELDRHAWLLLSLLHKRALSSAFALATSAERRLQLLDDGPGGASQQLLLPIDDESGDLDSTDAAPMWSVPALRDGRRERQLLQRVYEAARLAEGEEAKLRRLRRLLRVVREPVIVFTEYRDTLMHLRSQVVPHAAVVHGGMTRDQRRAALDEFRRCGVLLATDAAGEGLNLQATCRVVVNLELPWNPMRLEQRIGRVDRIGQRRRVHVFHLIAGHAERRLLDRLSTRVSRADASVGAPNPLCGRPEWTEEASARLVVLRDDSPRSAATRAVTPAVPVTRLEAEGRAESQRVALVRTLLGSVLRPSNDEGPSRRPSSAVLAARTRRRQARVRLGGRTLRLYRTTLVDGAGHAVATRIHGVVDASTVPEAGGTAASAASHQDASKTTSDLWLRAALDTHRRFADERVRRADAIAHLFDDSRAEQQPGLFDRRAEITWQRLTDIRREAFVDAEERQARAETSRQVSVSGPELALLLVPRGGVA